MTTSMGTKQLLSVLATLSKAVLEVALALPAVLAMRGSTNAPSIEMVAGLITGVLPKLT